MDAVYETARDLHAAGFVSKHRMKEYDALPVFDEEAMRAVIGCTRGRLGKTSDEWVDETRGRADKSPRQRKPRGKG